MSDKLYEFSDGPYEILNYTVKTDDGKVIIEQNENDLGRITIESLEAVEAMREALEQMEVYFKDRERRSEEL